MASNRMGFKQFAKKAEAMEHVDIILDTNILIAYFDEDHRQFDIVNEFLNRLDEVTDVDFFSTVTVKSEFLDYRRRFHLTDGLLSLVDEHAMGLGLSLAAKAGINTQKAQLTRRRNPNPGELPVENEFDIETNPAKRLFYDTEIKNIKKSFRAKDVQDEKGWVAVCRTYLREKLIQDEELVDSFTSYLSTRNEDHKTKYFDNKEIKWNEATNLCASTGMGYSDAMILNVLKSTTIPYLATLDFDLVYGTSVNVPGKTVLTPDERLSDYKKMLKDAGEILDLPRPSKPN